LVCQNDLWRKLKAEFAKVKLIFGEGVAKVVRFHWNTWIFEDEVDVG